MHAHANIVNEEVVKNGEGRIYEGLYREVGNAAAIVQQTSLAKTSQAASQPVYWLVRTSASQPLTKHSGTHSLTVI